MHTADDRVPVDGVLPFKTASGRFRRFFDDVLVVAAAGLPAKLVEKLEPWPLAEVVPFDQRYLAGYLAQTYDFELHDGFLAGKRRIDRALHDDVINDIGGDEQRVKWVHTTYDPITYKHLLLPVWILAYRYGEKSYRVLVNAGTGEVQGERPWSWWKIGATVLVIAAAAAAVLYWNR
ncbi:hypothetical protein [Endothiovibrio diazotrophicus]